MGALERDNGVHLDKFSHQPHFKRPDVSPLAITSRSTPNSMLGGKPAFKQLCKKAKEVNMQLMVDVLTRISSARMH